MSERQGREGERLGPNIDTQGRRMDDPRGTNDGPRPVGESRSESYEGRGQHGAHRRGDDDRGADAEGRGTSWLSVILGWLAGLGAGLILSGIVGGIVGAILGTGGASSSATEGGTAGLVGLLITVARRRVGRGR